MIKGVRYFLAHAPGLVRHGSKPSREIRKAPELVEDIGAHLRSYEEAVAYPPNRAFLGGIYPDGLAEMKLPWHHGNGGGERWLPHGEIMPEEELYGLLKLSDSFDLVSLEEGFAMQAREALAHHPLIRGRDLEGPIQGVPASAVEARLAGGAVDSRLRGNDEKGSGNDGKGGGNDNPGGGALPLYLRDGRLVGCVIQAHEEDASLTADILLENLACKSSAAMALLTLLNDYPSDVANIEYVINAGEEAVGERYQRGGGNLAKAIAEMCGLDNATGSDVKAFCCGPVHAIVMAAALVSSGIFRNVAVVGGCSLAKLGMKFEGHLRNDMPVLEDILASFSVLVGEDDGVSPVIRMDSVGRHNVGAGSGQQAIFEKLVADPLDRLGLGFQDIDKYATELHNPEVTEPAGSGNVPNLNYRLVGALAVRRGEITREELPSFVETHGMPGFSPTQGHIASAVPFMGHAVDRLIDGRMQRAMFLAKGSLFLGRMTQLADGLSFVLEANPARP